MAEPAPIAPVEEAAPAASGDSRRREREPEEEDNTITLEEYLAKQKEAAAAAIPKLEGVRKVEDQVPEGATPLQKDAENSDYFVGKVEVLSLHLSRISLIRIPDQICRTQGSH